LFDQRFVVEQLGLAKNVLQAASAERRAERLKGEVRRWETRDGSAQTSAVFHKNLSIQCLRGMSCSWRFLAHRVVRIDARTYSYQKSRIDNR